MITVYGASDDLIEVEGDIVEEFSAYDADKADGKLLAFSDGTVLRVKFDDGIWRITPVARGGAVLAVQQATEDDDDEGTDRGTLDGDITWVVYGTAYAHA